jgi:hypothetical protein
MTIHQEALHSGVDDRGRAPPVNGHAHDFSEQDPETFDVDLFPSSSQLFGTRNESTSRAHIFSQVKILRGDRDQFADDDEESHEAYRRRIGDFRDSSHLSSLAFPLLSSFPGIFQSTRSPRNVDIDVSVITSTRIAERIRAIEADARRLIGLDEREALCEGLAVMAEEYADGWSSDEDDDED